MCGIAGFFGRGGSEDLAAMMRAQLHRGPDDEGVHIDSALRVFLGFRRLTIRDAAGGTQPMWNEDQSVAVIFNGEIYNHVELRAELERRGHLFRSSHSDTEVLVHGYEQWGAALPERLNGMFAFAVFDSRRHRLFLARDRFGEKPLYYYATPDLFAFASELHALVQHSAVEARPNVTALRKLFAYGYIPAPHALYDGTAKLPAGHSLELDFAQGAIPKIRCYWRFAIEPDEDHARRGEPALIEELRELILQAAQRRLVSDVPLGIFLSGGIDSSMILAALTRYRNSEDIKAFSIGFTEPTFDESSYARLAAGHFEVRHHLRTLDMARASNMIGTVLGKLDEPMGDPSILPSYMLSAFTREYVTVALSGDGGDELFAGYDPFDALGPGAIYRQIVPPGLHRFLLFAVDHLPRSSANMSLDFKLRRTLMGLSHPPHLWAPVWMAPLPPEFAAELFGAEVPVEEIYDDAIVAWDGCRVDDPADRLMEFFTRFYLQDDILTKTDRASMMHSLETRAVFLDNDLVEFCRRLPRRFKYRNGERKYLLRRAAQTLLPKRITSRRKKGFGIPLADWLMRIPPEPPLEPVAGLSVDWVRGAWSDHRSRRKDHRLLLWTWLSLQYVLARSTRPLRADAPIVTLSTAPFAVATPPSAPALTGPRVAPSPSE
jgi:asparagine synthase (glutamine-hydrolysing)